MGIKAWVTYVIVFLVILAATLCGIFFLVPQIETTNVQAGEYESIIKMEYTYAGNKVTQKEKDYKITSDVVDKALDEDKYEEGNINPFTPPKDITIYNEPTLMNGNKDQNNLSPSDK